LRAAIAPLMTAAIGASASHRVCACGSTGAIMREPEEMRKAEQFSPEQNWQKT
jgi:hypothetical protein